MFGTEIVPISTQSYNTIQSNLKVIETNNIISLNMDGYPNTLTNTEDEQAFEQIAQVILGDI